MSYMAPSPPKAHSRRLGVAGLIPAQRMPIASAGLFSKSELVHGTVNGLYG